MNHIWNPIDSIERKIEARKFRRDPIQHWTWIGAWTGAGLGLAVAAGILLVGTWGTAAFVPAPHEVLPFVGPLVATGALVSAVVVRVWMSLARPVLAALFWKHERFLREYGYRDSPKDRQDQRSKGE